MNTIFDYAKEVVAATWMHSFAARGEFRSLKDKTALTIPGALSKEVCEELVRRLDRLAEDRNHPRIWRDKVDSDTRIWGFEQDIPDLCHHFEIERRIRAVDDYLGLRTRSWFLMANRILPKESNLGSGGGLHRDSPFSHQVKCIWYLSDVTAETGPFQYVPGTHFNQLRTRATYPVGQSRFDKVNETLVEVHADAGTLLVCDTKCIHGGKPIQTGVRYAVTLYTLPQADGAANMFRKLGIDPALAARPQRI